MNRAGTFTFFLTCTFMEPIYHVGPKSVYGTKELYGREGEEGKKLTF